MSQSNTVDWIRAFTAKPYPTREAFGLVWRNLAGASFRNPHDLRFTPRHTRLNEILPELTLGLGGDVMSMFGKALRFAPEVAGFFSPCHKVLLNFEGVITEQRQISPDQKHTRPILGALDGLATRDKLVLSLANNHTGDFGEAECRRSLSMLHDEGFTAFGLTETPFIDLHERLRVATGTRWSNREGGHLAWLRDPTQYVRPGAFNLLYFGAACTVALATSGTVSTELALAGAPMVISYRFGGLSYAIMKPFFTGKFATLFNTAADEMIAPELIQNDATGEKLADAVSHLLADPALRAGQSARQTAALDLMGRDGRDPSEIAAEAVLKVIAEAA